MHMHMCNMHMHMHVCVCASSVYQCARAVVFDERSRTVRSQPARPEDRQTFGRGRSHATARLKHGGRRGS